jgi:hypothetical protein
MLVLRLTESDPERTWSVRRSSSINAAGRLYAASMVHCPRWTPEAFRTPLYEAGSRRTGETARSISAKLTPVGGL